MGERASRPGHPAVAPPSTSSVRPDPDDSRHPDRRPFPGPSRSPVVRRFSAAYLADTRRGLWEDRKALAGLDLGHCERILDVGSGIGSLASAFRAETDATVVCLDADRVLLSEMAPSDRLVGDAIRLPLVDGSFDLVACQALLVNLRRPADAVREFARVSSGQVAAVEPDNATVTVDSTVPAEETLAARARDAYLDGVDTDPTLGGDVGSVFESVGLAEVTTTRHELVRTVEPPYRPRDVEDARRKATGSGLAAHEPELLAGGLSRDQYEALVSSWRRMGRTVAHQLQAGEYRRTERVPCFITVGRVRPA